MRRIMSVFGLAAVLLFAQDARAAEDIPAVEKMLIERDCVRLENEYAAGLDNFDADQFANVFSETATMDLFQRNFPGSTLPHHITGGRKAMHAYMIQRGVGPARAGKPKTIHLITNVQVQVIDRDRARSTGYEVMFRWNPDKPETITSLAPVLWASTATEYVRTAEGWKIQARTIHAVGP